MSHHGSPDHSIVRPWLCPIRKKKKVAAAWGIYLGFSTAWKVLVVWLGCTLENCWYDGCRRECRRELVFGAVADCLGTGDAMVFSQGPFAFLLICWGTHVAGGCDAWVHDASRGCCWKRVPDARLGRAGVNRCSCRDPRIPWVEIREEGVISPGGILESVDAQRTEYRQENLATCLVTIAQAVRRFKDLTSVHDDPAWPRIGGGTDSRVVGRCEFVCTWQSLRGSIQQSPRLGPVFPIRGGVFVQLRGAAQDELVRITISARGRTWRSDYESVDTVDVQVKE